MVRNESRKSTTMERTSTDTSRLKRTTDRNAKEELSFVDRVAHEERLLSARNDAYRECEVMDEAENDRKPHGKMCWKAR